MSARAPDNAVDRLYTELQFVLRSAHRRSVTDLAKVATWCEGAVKELHLMIETRTTACTSCGGRVDLAELREAGLCFYCWSEKRDREDAEVAAMVEAGRYSGGDHAALGLMMMGDA